MSIDRYGGLVRLGRSASASPAFSGGGGCGAGRQVGQVVCEVTRGEVGTVPSGGDGGNVGGSGR